MMNVGVVIATGPGRMQNLVQVLGCLREQTEEIECIVIVQDGPDAHQDIPLDFGDQEFVVVRNFKHEPGLEQPRNIGVRMLGQYAPATDHVWFLDSDIIVLPDCLERYQEAHEMVQTGDEMEDGKYVTFKPLDRILIGPYDWMDPGVRHPQAELHNDPRWPSFTQETPFYPGTEDRLPLAAIATTKKLNDGLACFSGNLIWPIADFVHVGGFWNEIHHGRCEDGELGLRAVSHGIPITHVPDARGWHLWHEVDVARNMAANERDVPMLNARHPWVLGEGLFVVERDGRRFDQLCPVCDDTVNTLDWWAHMAEHSNVEATMPTPMPGG